MKEIIIFSLITDDISLRLKPIISYLSQSYNKITIALYDWMKGDYDFSHIINELQKTNCSVVAFKTIKDAKRITKHNFSAEYLYLIKYPPNNPYIVNLCYLFFTNNASKKWLTLSNLILIRRLLQGTTTKKDRFVEILKIIAIALFGFLLYSFFFIQSIFAYHIIFKPLVFFLRNRAYNKENNFKNILFIRMDHLGDIICTLPALKALKEKYPDSNITILAASWSCQPLKANPHLYDDLILWDAPWHNKKKNYRMGSLSLIKFLFFLKKMRATHYDLVIQPRGEGMNVVLAALLNKTYSISGIDPKRPLSLMMSKYIDKSIILNPYRTYHISEWPELCLKELGIKIEKKHIKNAYKTYYDHEIQKKIEHYKNNNYKICSIVIGAGSKVRLWRPNRFRDIISELYKNGVISVLLGGKEDITIKNKINISIPHIDLVGKTDFQNIEFVLRSSDFVISLDTSIMHLASLLGKKVVALFGAGNTNLARPVFSNSYVIKKELGCSGCGDICIFSKLERYPCMELITINDTLKGLKEIKVF